MHFWLLKKVLGLNEKELNNNIFKNYKHNESRKQQMKKALKLTFSIAFLRNNHIVFCEEKNLTQTIKHQLLRQTFLTLTMGILSPSFLYTVPKIIIQRISQFSRSVISDSVQPHGLQHTRVPCPSPTPVACSNSCPSSR